MKITFRLVVSLFLVVALAAVAFSYHQASEEKILLKAEVERRSVMLAESLHESITPLVQSNSTEKLRELVQRFCSRGKYQWIAVQDTRGQVLTATAGLDPSIPG